jgi:signal transduction histidine kinase
MPSLRGKITFGCYVVAAVVTTLALLDLAALGWVERKVIAGQVVADLLQDTLEMRRNEKKYFLSGNGEDLEAALEHTDAALARLDASAPMFARVASADEMTELKAQLARYRSLLARYAEVSRSEHNVISEEARNAGHLASQAAKVLSGRDREDLTQTVQDLRTALVASFVPLVVLVVVGGRALSARVLGPLGQLEAHLKPIAEGRYHHLALPTLDREIVSFARAFNGMLGELQARQEQLRHSERLASLGTLVSGVAHEMNNPLANISSSTQLLLEEGERASPEQRRAWLEQVDGETERARRIVRTLLDYARKGPLRPRQDECVALEEVPVGARRLAGGDADGASRVSLDVPPDLVIVADEERLRQVFINLIKNALDAGPSGARVRVSARRATWAESPPASGSWTVGAEALSRAGDQPLIQVRVEDEGPGIPPALLPRIFDPFFTTREAGQGTGLGLFIVQEIVQEHGGCVGAENRPQGGACFTVWLPAGCEGQAP